MTDSLEGLSAELKKAAYCRWCFDKETRNLFCDNGQLNKHSFVLSAALVAKEIQNLKLCVQNELAKELNKKSNSLNRDELLIKLIEKVEEVF